MASFLNIVGKKSFLGVEKAFPHTLMCTVLCVLVAHIRFGVSIAVYIHDFGATKPLEGKTIEG